MNQRPLKPSKKAQQLLQQHAAELNKKQVIISDEEKSSNPILNIVYKRIRNLNKKLLNIQQLQKQQKASLKQQQKQKIERKQETINEIKKNEQWVITYKSLVAQNNGQFYDPNEMLVKIGTLIGLGQFIDKNKGFLFKLDIGQNFKGCYQTIYKLLSSPVLETNLIDRINSIVATLSQYNRQDKFYASCKQFIAQGLHEKKQQQTPKLPSPPKPSIQPIKPIKPSQPSSQAINTRPSKKKITSKDSWAAHSSDQQQIQQKPQQIDITQTSKPSHQPQSKPTVQISKQLSEQPAQKPVQQNIQSIIPQPVKSKQPNHPNRGYVQKQVYRPKDTNGQQSYKLDNQYPKSNYNNRDNRDNRDNNRYYKPHDNYRQYQNEYKTGDTYSKHYDSSERHRYDEENYHKPRNNQRGKYQNKQKDSDTSLESTPEKRYAKKQAQTTKEQPRKYRQKLNE